MEKTEIRIPREAAEILAKLNENGYEAYAVGGCVRDSLLGREPEDWDITTNAAPQQVKALFRRTVDTGIEHGTVTVMYHKTGYEVTTYRLDGGYSDGRHPDQVTFTPSLSEDLRRRDFTINAMAYSERDGLVDLFSGQEDLSAGIVRCVGDPEERFTEDALRILRAVRFSAQLGFEIETGTWNAIKNHAPNLARISRERIFAELNKTLLSDHPEKLLLLSAAGIAPYISESFTGVTAEERIAGLPKEKPVRWAAAFSEIPAEKADRILRELKSDNETATETKILVRELGRELPADKPGIRKLLSEIGKDRFNELLLLGKAGFGRNTDAAQLTAAGEKAAEILAAGDCISLKQLALTGNDLIRCGIRPGPALGETLNRLLTEVLFHPEYNTPEKLKTLL